MVVYNLLCADLSSDFIDFIPGSIVEEKLLTLQDKLGDDFPRIILQYLCDDENRIVQIKGCWEDITNVHDVLESWMGGCESSMDAGIGDVIAEKVEGITGGVFFDKDNIRTTTVATEIKAEKQTEDGDLAEHSENSEGRQDLVEDEELSYDMQTDDVDTAEGNSSLFDNELEKSTSSENVSTRGTPKKARKPKAVRKPRSTHKSENTPQSERQFNITNTVTRSGRVVKKAFAVQELYPEEYSDDLVKSSTIRDGGDTEDTLHSSQTSDKVLNEMTINDIDTDLLLDPIVDPDDLSPEKAKSVSETRGRKRKSLTKIPMDAVNLHVEDAAAAATNPEEIHCLLCDFKTNAKRHLKCHLVRCHVTGEYVCKICKIRSYSLEKDLRAHMKAHYPKLKCSRCERKFPTKTLRDLHMLKFHELGERKRIYREEKNRPTKCNHCDHIAENDRNMKDHVARHHAAKTFICPVCSKGFGLKKDMVAHAKAHSDVFYCDECGKQLHSKGALKLHVDSIHRGIKKVINKIVMCDHCGQTCRSATHYKEHVNREHLKVKPFGCPLCSMAFYTNGALKQHLITHTSMKQHVCSTCGRNFRHANSLRVHQASHLDYTQRPHACGVCSKTFSQKGALVRHMRIHTGEKPYKCRLCDSAFTDYSILRRHMLGVHKVNSRDLCQRPDISGNRGGPKPERVKVENIVKYKNVIRQPTQIEDNSKTFEISAEDESKKFEISAEDMALIKSHSLKVEEQMKIKDKMQLRLAPTEDKFVYPSLDESSQSGYVIHDQSLDREANFVVAELTPHLAHDIGVSAGYTVLQQNEPINVAHDLGYPNIPFSVQHIPGNDGQNIAIQILQTTPETGPFFMHGKS